MIEIVMGILTKFAKWVEAYPAFFNGLCTILGIILGAIFDVRKRTISIVSKTTNNIKELHIVSYFFNHCNFGGGKKIEDDSNKDFRQKIMLNKPSSLLSPKQIKICEQIYRITKENSNESFDFREEYENAIKEKNSHGVDVATINYYQLFGKIVIKLKYIAEDKNAKTEIINLEFVVNGLFEMIEQQVDPERLKIQIKDCESAITRLLAKL